MPLSELQGALRKGIEFMFSHLELVVQTPKQLTLRARYARYVDVLAFAKPFRPSPIRACPVVNVLVC